MNPPIALFVLALSVLHPLAMAAQDHAPTTHEQPRKQSDLKQHGAMAMGFDQDKAIHHFTLTANGGTIAVTAKDPSDRTTRDYVQAHLQEIAAAFKVGDFEKPLMTHGEMPPGVAEMQRFKTGIKYTFEPTVNGGVVRIATSNDRALRAVHEFLRYQIREHATGDPVTIQK